VPQLPKSNWVITSYTALAHARKEPGLRHGGADEVTVARETGDIDETAAVDDIRFRLKGSSHTGDCLHGFYEQLAKEATLYCRDAVHFNRLLQRCLRQHDLERPELLDQNILVDAEKEKIYSERLAELSAWLQSTLDTPLLANDSTSTLRRLYLDKQVLPELDFDFALGTLQPANIRDGINRVLSNCQVSGIHVPEHIELEGLVTGSIDLLFIHNKKIYVLDYKSNTLGKAPHFYDQTHMTQAMQDNRYDLQYLIYSVAAHRYMKQRLGSGYAFDAPQDKTGYSFGGVLYLFLRGMGLENYPRHGIWFHRPGKQEIESLDAAFMGLTDVE
jgi:exodeoxyribonuclease V beta subunit